jgi:hypothetical protein
MSEMCVEGNQGHGKSKTSWKCAELPFPSAFWTCLLSITTLFIINIVEKQFNSFVFINIVERCQNAISPSFVFNSLRTLLAIFPMLFFRT